MKKQTGFTLIELMIVVAIVAILAAIALPAYQKYTAKAKFTEVITATNGVKQQVELCIYDKGGKTGCTNTATSGASGSGWNIAKAADYTTKYVDTITVTNGSIVAKAKNTEGLGAATYTLAPSTSGAAGQVTWTATCSAGGSPHNSIIPAA